MRKPSRKAILDALTCDSSADGCDPDWRSAVLANADPDDLAKVKAWLTEKPDELPRETITRLKIEGKIRY